MSIESRNCSLRSRSVSAPVFSRRRSASVDLPWSMWAMIEKLRMCETGSEYISETYACASVGRRRRKCTLTPFLVEPLVGPPQPVFERDARLPAELSLGRRRVDDAAALLAGLGWPVRRLDLVAGDRDQPLRERDDVGLAARADVDRADERAVERLQIGAHQILDVHVIAGLLAVAVDARRLAAQELLAEDRHHAGCPVGILAWAVGGGIAT